MSENTGELKKQTEKLAEALQSSEERFHNIINKSADGIVVVDGVGDILFANPAAESLFDRSAADLLGRSFGFPVVAGKDTEIEIVLPGRIIVAAMRVVETQWEGKDACLATLRDVTDRKKMEEEIRHMAFHDALTDLPNRRLLMDFIKIETAQARRHQTKMALLLMDLDRFKEVNDTLGHEAGDELLKQAASRFKAAIRESDTISRTGGDEFTIIGADIGKPEYAADIALKIIETMKKPFFIAGHYLHITISLGVSIYPDDSDEINTLFRYADIAMYYAKEQGRNTFRFYNPAINVRSLEEMRLESMLRQAVERGELVVYYQPVIGVVSREMTCAEALVRWKHPELGLLDPKQFIHLAENTGYIAAIDEWVLKIVCAQTRAWLDAGLDPGCITVNLSAREFQDPYLVMKFSGILKEAGMPPQRLNIEITESLAMSDIERTIYRLNELAKMGVGVSIDDFGTGYSSLSQLKRLPIQKLKIDRSFVKDIAHDSEDRAIIKAVTAMAHSLSMRVLAEGVETDDQLSSLRTADCDEAQGYLISRALPADEFEKAFLVHK